MNSGVGRSGGKPPCHFPLCLFSKYAKQNLGEIRPFQESSLRDSALSEAKFTKSVLNDKVVNLSIMSLIGFESPDETRKYCSFLLLKGTVVPFNWRATFHSSQTKVYFDSFCLKGIVSPIIRSAAKLYSRHFNFHRKCDIYIPVPSQPSVIFLVS